MEPKDQHAVEIVLVWGQATRVASGGGLNDAGVEPMHNDGMGTVTQPGPVRCGGSLAWVWYRSGEAKI